MPLVVYEHSVSLIFNVDFSKITVHLFVFAQREDRCIRSCFQGAALSYTACGGDPF